MARFAADFSDYVFQERLSDVDLMVEPEAAADDHPSTLCETEKMDTVKCIPAHGMVLAAFSKYCKAKLDNWASSDGKNSADRKLQIRLPVPAGQLDLAQLLIKGMYQQQPTVTDGLNPEQLLQLMLLADKFEIPKVLAAALQAFSDVPASYLQWKTALQILCLPPSCAEQPEFQATQVSAVQRIHCELGDLEVVWGDECRQQLLLGLPFSAFEQLLKHPDTSTASENTVIFSILRWYRAQEVQELRQLKQLMALVRMQHCSALYISTVLAHDKLYNQCFTAVEQGLAWQCSMQAGYETLLKSRSPIFDTYPAWKAAKRPASSRPQLVEWKMPLATLRGMIEAVTLTKGAEPLSKAGPATALQGHVFAVSVQVNKLTPCIGVFLQRLMNVPFGICQVHSCMTCKAVTGSAANDVTAGSQFDGAYDCYTEQDQSWGYDLLPLECQQWAEWQAVEIALKQRQLVHGGSSETGPYLHFVVELLKVL